MTSVTAGAATAGSGTAEAARESLANGLTVVVRENPAAPVVALTLFVGVGSRDETVETNGVTALLGRVLLKGTRTRSALALAQAADDAGGALESGTEQEYSELRARGLARHWPALLELLRDIATAPAFAADEIERERETLLAQIRSLEDQPFQVANRLLSRALYGTHPGGLPTSGEPESVTGLSRDALVRHFDAFVAPERMILAVSGQVVASEVVREVARVFGGLETRGGGGPAPPPPRGAATPRVTEARPTQQTQLLAGFLAPPIGHPDYAALKVATAILGAGMSGRLFRTLRDEEGLAYAVGSFYPTRRETSRVVIYLGTAPANLSQAERGIERQLTRLREEPVPADELARSQAFLSGSFDLDLRTNARQGFYLGFFELMGVGHAYVGRYRERLLGVTEADVQRVARRYLAEPTVAIVGPIQTRSMSE
ncbi:MAG TPA: pitrilysin family protein [Methylomirabilota bacterium]|nr:pitrilysin family protein [Methylomirabilota bacterium]